MTLSQFLHTIKTAPVEKLGVIYHGDKGRLSCVGYTFAGEGDHRSIKRVSLQTIMDNAARFGAKGMTLVHNHPRSDTPRPSEHDLHTTFTIHDIAKKAGVPVLDHVIFGANGSAFSFVRNGIAI